MRKLALLNLLWVLQGCTTLHPDYYDMSVVTFQMSHKQAEDFTSKPIQVTLSLYKREADLQEVCERAGASKEGRIGPYRACAITWHKGCAIATMQTTTATVLGHELIHCLATEAGPEKWEGLHKHFHIEKAVVHD